MVRRTTDAARIRITWGDAILFENVLSPPREFWLGEHGADFVLPTVALGLPRLRLLRVEAGRCFVATADSPVQKELVRGANVSRRFGDFTVEVGIEDALRPPKRRLQAGMLAYFFAATALAGSVLGAGALAPPRSDGVTGEQLRLMNRYLNASAERELREQAGEDDPEAREGGTGSRAKGETSRKAAAIRQSSTRYAVQGSRDARDPHSLREAQQFGMIALLNTGAAGDPNAPAEPWGRDSSRGSDDANMWGDGMEPSEIPLGAANPDPISGEQYADHGINHAVDPSKDRMSTFAVDVDTGSYTIAKRKLGNGMLPPLEAVRVEEFVNAFDYEYPGPEEQGSREAFAVHLHAAPSPFEAQKHLLRVALQGTRASSEKRPPVHLVYLVDTSGSMQSADKIGLVQHSLRLLTASLKPTDTVAICTYAGFVREVLAPTSATDHARIFGAIDELSAEGSTAMASGIDLAYSLASRGHVPGHISRVVVLSDGDANVGPARADDILRIIDKYKRQGITLSTVGYGVGNYKDALMERLADAGDGNYSYIGDERDAKRVFVDHVAGLLQVIARDVKIQVEFDPRVVESYRLVGYENRDVADHQFRDDSVDGGEIGAGHAVTALYELRLRDTLSSPLRVHLRYKPALAGDTASEFSVTMPTQNIAARFADAPESFRFAIAIAAFAEALRGNPYAMGWSFERIRTLADEAAGSRAERSDVLSLIDTARVLRTSG